jgi:hypothetical protein
MSSTSSEHGLNGSTSGGKTIRSSRNDLALKSTLAADMIQCGQNKAIEAVFYKIALEDAAVIEGVANTKDVDVKAHRKTNDQDQIDVDVVVNVEAPQAEDIEVEDLEEEYRKV